MRIISFNIQNRAFESEKDHQQRMEQCARLILSRKPDIACLQEVNPASYAALKNHLAGAVSLNVPRDDGKLEGEGAPVFCFRENWSIHHRDRFWLSQTPHIPSRSWRARANRIATVMALETQADHRSKLWIISLHLDHRSRQARRQSLLVLDQYIQEHTDTGDRIVICGDFNMPPHSRALRAFLKRPPHLVDAASSHPRNAAHPTFLGWSRLKLAKQRIDYCLHSPNLTCLNYQVHLPEVDDWQISDHALLLAELEVPSFST